MLAVLDAVQNFLETNRDEEIALKVYSTLAKLISVTGIQHPLFQDLLQRCREEVRSVDPQVRRRSFSVFRIFSKHLDKEDAAQFYLRYLGDSTSHVQSKALHAMAEDNILSTIFSASELVSFVS
jgi:hypothetical protein